MTVEGLDVDVKEAKDFVMTRTIPAEKMLELAKSIMDNYPEASSGNCLKCEDWKYKQGIFEFYDEEEGKKHTVKTIDVANKGLPIFLSKILEGKYPGFGITPDNLLDGGSYDGYAIDGVVQCVIFGEVIYG